MVAELDALELLVTPKRPQPRALEWADLGRLTYLQAVIKARARGRPPSRDPRRLGGQPAGGKAALRLPAWPHACCHRAPERRVRHRPGRRRLASAGASAGGRERGSPAAARGA